MSRRGDYSAIIRAAQRAGCTVALRARHVVLRTPGGGRVVASSSPSDVNAAKRTCGATCNGRA